MDPDGVTFTVTWNMWWAWIGKVRAERDEANEARNALASQLDATNADLQDAIKTRESCAVTICDLTRQRDQWQKDHNTEREMRDEATQANKSLVTALTAAEETLFEAQYSLASERRHASDLSNRVRAMNEQIKTQSMTIEQQRHMISKVVAEREAAIAERDAAIAERAGAINLLNSLRRALGVRHDG
jgi:chromosome segregation ATPase